jgi:hypothetical protein
LIGLAAQRGWKLFHMDVKTVFLHRDLDEEVYITQPRGFEISGNEHLVLRLNKAFYGLKQAPKMWYEKIDSYLRAQGFKKGTGDYNLYVIRKEDKILLLALYVDDLLFTGNCDKWIDWFKHQLESRFKMSELNEGEITLYLKAESIQVPEGIFLTQRGYTWKILEQFEMADCLPVSTPMVEKLKLVIDMS